MRVIALILCNFTLFALGFSEIAMAMRNDTATYQRRLKENKLVDELASFKAGLFTVFIDRKISDNLRSGIKLVIERAAADINYHLGYSPTDEAELILLHGNTYDSIDDPRVASGGFYANKKIRLNFQYDKEEAELLNDFDRVFRHEYTHLMIASIDGGRTPRWLNEGLAVFEGKKRSERKRGEGRAYVRSLSKKGQVVSIDEFVKTDLVTQYTQNSSDFYTRSYILAKYLVEQYGNQKLQELFRAMKGGKNFTFALKDVYGLSLEALAKGAYES